MSSQLTHPTDQAFEGLLSVNQVARILGISPKTVRHMVLTGRIEYVKIGARVLFRPETLRKMIENCTVPVRSHARQKPVAPNTSPGYNKRALTRKRAA